MRVRCLGTALYEAAWPRFQSQVSSARAAPVAAEIRSQACTAQARISRSSASRRAGARRRRSGRRARRGAQHAVHPQHVGHEVVGEDREPVEVLERRHPGEREVVRDDLGALPEAHVIEEGIPEASIEASRTADPPASLTSPSALRSPRNRPSPRNACA